ncbi:MAG: hypothetical protein ACLFTE_03780 [Salinivenus sp.]
MKLLQRLHDTYLSVSASTFSRVTKVVDHCPHCDEETPWVVRVLTGYYRCTQCGRDPMRPASSHGDASPDDRAPVPPARSEAARTSSTP